MGSKHGFILSSHQLLVSGADMHLVLQQHSMQYPTVARIAKDFLAIQGSAVPSERAFSSSALTATACRNRLLSETFGQLQLLKSAYRKGHISAANEAELVAPRARSPITFE